MSKAECLKFASWCYGVAIFQHIDTDQPGVDVDAYNYIAAQADFVRNNTEDVVAELERLGVSEIDYKHLQYFFSIEPPVYEPYMQLMRFCFHKMEESGVLPTNGESTFVRLMLDKRTRRFLNLPLDKS